MKRLYRTLARRGAGWSLTAAWALAACSLPEPAEEGRLEVVELDIAAIHEGLRSGAFTCSELVAAYLARIEAYDRRGPALHAIVTVNPEAAVRAREADARIRASGLDPGRPLECVPTIVKDNYDTAGLPTTAGSRSLQDSVPPDDAFQVRRIREAGAIVLAKSNMAEYAFSPYETLGSVVPGHTRNPYDPYRVPAGSSGGTAAAVAASFGAVGLGTDTGNSIRGPSSHTALFGIRSTMGLTSRDGIVPLNLFRDIGGPMARTVEDAVRVFDVLAGADPARCGDPWIRTGGRLSRLSGPFGAHRNSHRRRPPARGLGDRRRRNLTALRGRPGRPSRPGSGDRGSGPHRAAR